MMSVVSSHDTEGSQEVSQLAKRVSVRARRDLGHTDGLSRCLGGISTSRFRRYRQNPFRGSYQLTTLRPDR
jgi:hypothetical protein